MVQFKTVQITDLTDEDLEAMAHQGQLIDVRETDEYEAGHIDGAQSYPLSSLNTKFPLDQSKTYYIYCQAGKRSQQASQMLSDSGFTVVNLNGGYQAIQDRAEAEQAQTAPAEKENFEEQPSTENTSVSELKPGRKKVNYSGMQCPGPLMNVNQELKQLQPAEQLEVLVTDPGFASDIKSWAAQTGNTLVDLKQNNNEVTAVIEKAAQQPQDLTVQHTEKGTTIVLFSGELDKALAAFIIANGARAAGREVSIFCTFWGLNALKRPHSGKVKKTGIERLFGMMLPNGPENMPLSKMNMFGLGRLMMKMIMKQKNVDSLPTLIDKAITNDIKLIACTMSMDVMGIKKEELRPEVEFAGVGTYIGDTEHANHNLFI
ncbi:DsrE/DsrF/DrsH-like family protein [Staphylococcus debuckii]|uniref:DsrE/DsrF/DrsH-like family protein n=1 Tax=Staphylococcus debuckii TaxID=2044912 RepID=UPI000F42EA15|nr:DsrE/DsrF/DrsH-like family protein [Staphylococcus debuckii]AYU54392.1 dihydroneopterin aldolase [Staphylococcus debuckii]